MTMYLRLLLFLTICCSTGYCLYIDDSFPYSRGPLSVESKYFGDDVVGPPYDTLVVYPNDTSNTYAVVFFIGGLRGLVPGDLYSEVLTRVASHGYIILAPFTGLDIIDINVETMVEVFEFVRYYWDFYMTAKPDWDQITIGCHSLGGDYSHEIIRAYPEYNFKAALNMEPTSQTIGSPMPGSVPAMSYGTLLANTCSSPTRNHVAFYENWNCPRYMVESRIHGHCDFLNRDIWYTCGSLGFCPPGPEELLEEYKDFVSGLMVSFMNVYAQGSPDYSQYYTNSTNIPIDMSDFRQQEQC